jgi:glycosyltransferase involved in cell wall biosynthesis
MSYKIPKIIHQLWIGDKPPPSIMMKTWKDKHPDFEYILWNEDEFVRRNFVSNCLEQIQLISEINGKADIYRWEILYQYGGIFVDADSICIESLDPDIFLTKTGFAAFENETERGNLIATVGMGFVPQHPLCGDMIQWIQTSSDAKTYISDFKAWYSVGPALITRFLETGKYPDFTIFPSHFFLPHHFTGATYDGHKRVYAYQEWGTTKNNYDIINTIQLPPELSPPPPNQWISILIPSYNTPRKYIRECLDSIRSQLGSRIGFEVVWVNDGSDDSFSEILEKELSAFVRLSRFCKVNYYKTTTNKGVAECLRKGVEWCSNEIIVRMDSDDIMVYNRIITQYKFMMENPTVPMCGTGIRAFQTRPATMSPTELVVKRLSAPCQNIHDKGGRPWCKDIVFPTITLEQYLDNPVSWIMSHPSLMMRKSAIIELGNYRNVYDSFQIIDSEGNRPILDDYDLECRCLKKYGIIHNLPNILMYYRIHQNQITSDGVLEKSKANQEAVSKIMETLRSVV